MVLPLIESRRPLVSGGAFGGGAVSLVIHSAVIAGALYATLVSDQVDTVVRPIIDVALAPQAEAPPPPVVQPVAAVPIQINVLAIPTNIPTVIPPPSRVAFDPTSFSGIGAGVASAWGRDTVTRAPVPRDAVYAADVVEELPERLGGPPPRYPEILRKAGIGGQVLVEFVIDTAGRAEPASISILRSTHVMFNQPVLDAVATWDFRPARLNGRAVRVRVQMPLYFEK